MSCRAALDQCKGRLIKFAIPDTAKLIAQICLYSCCPGSRIIELAGSGLRSALIAITIWIVGGNCADDRRRMIAASSWMRGNPITATRFSTAR